VSRCILARRSRSSPTFVCSHLAEAEAEAEAEADRWLVMAITDLDELVVEAPTTTPSPP